jgi:hypothetical protein
MYKGPVGPDSKRTGRSIAEEKNDPANFKDGPAYDVVKGLPKAMDKGGEYKPLTLKMPEAKPAQQIQTPFVITSK